MDTPMDVNINGPTMAWALSHALARTDVDEIHAIFGQQRILLKEGNITDAEGAGVTNTRKAIDITIKFITKLPKHVWNPNKKEWNHPDFKKWEGNVKAILRLNRSIRIVGLARFRRCEIQKPFSLRDSKLCLYISEQEKIPIVLMGVTLPFLKPKNLEAEDLSLTNSILHGNHEEQQEKNYLTGPTTVTTGYFDANEKDYDYINLELRNLGQEPASYLTEAAQGRKFASVASSQDLVVPLVHVSQESAQLRRKLQAVHDEYQQKQLHLVRQLTSSTITASSNSVSKKSSYKDFQQDIAESELVEKQGCKRPKMER